MYACSAHFILDIKRDISIDKQATNSTQANVCYAVFATFNNLNLKHNISSDTMGISTVVNQCE